MNCDLVGKKEGCVATVINGVWARTCCAGDTCETGHENKNGVQADIAWYVFMVGCLI